MKVAYYDPLFNICYLVAAKEEVKQSRVTYKVLRT